MKETRQASSGRGRWLTFGFRAVTLLVALLAFEGTLRLFTPPGFLEWPFLKWPYLVKDPVAGWKNRSNFDPVGPRIPFRINALGLRGSEVESVKPQGVRRIVSMGDSGTFGIWLDRDPEAENGRDFRYDNDYPGKLAALFDQKGPGNIEVINAGVIGYSSSHGLRQLNTLLLDLQPDVLAVRFGYNDYLKAWDRSLCPDEPSNPALRGLLYHFLRWKLAQIALRANQYVYFRNPQWTRGPWVSLEKFEANLRRFAQISRAEGIHLLFIDYPLRPLSIGEMPGDRFIIARLGQKDLKGLHAVHARYQAALFRIAHDQKVPVLETTTQLHQLDPPRFGDLDFAHPNDRGSLEIATRLREKLIELNWIPGNGYSEP